MQAALPESLAGNRNPLIIKGDKRIGIISDLHIPYHDTSAISTALTQLKKERIDTLILNGDIVDFYAVSFWERKPSRFLVGEIDIARCFFEYLRKTLGEVEIIYREANHEERLERFIARKAPELDGIDDITVRNLLRLKDHNIKYIKSKRIIRAGSLSIIHGDEYRGNWGLVNMARSLRMKAQDNLVFGHYHKTQEDVGNGIHGNLTGAWSVGCLCDLSPDYMPLNQWNHGYAIVDLFKNNHFSIINKKIYKNEIY